MERIKLNKQILKLHIFNWLVVILLRNIILTPIEEKLVDRISQSLVDLFTFSTAYYFFCFIISPFIEFKKWKFSVWLLIIYFIVWNQIFFMSDRILAMIADNDFTYFAPNLNEISWTTAYICAIALLSHGFYKKQISIQRLIIQSEIEQINLKQETLFLKNQFNSHISLNFLSYCYASSIKSDENTSKAIETYSDMMKYTLLTDADTLVSLENEILYIEQFIFLQKLIGKRVEIVFKKPIYLNHVKILPRILINYVENAFKYGVSDNSESPIRIDLEIESENLILRVRNLKKPSTEFKISTGSGQINSKQQLELFYPNLHELIIIENEREYDCLLKIKVL